MKPQLTLLAVLAVTTISLVGSSQYTASARGPLTDSQMTQMGWSAHRMGMVPDRARTTPLGYAFVNQDGSKASGTANVTTSYDSGNIRYVVKFTGVNYFYSSFSTTVTPAIPTSTGSECRTDSIGGTMLVQCFNLAGSPIQAAFGFITF
jgi:hypothetical protein